MLSFFYEQQNELVNKGDRWLVIDKLILSHTNTSSILQQKSRAVKTITTEKITGVIVFYPLQSASSFTAVLTEWRLALGKQVQGRQ